MIHIRDILLVCLRFTVYDAMKLFMLYIDLAYDKVADCVEFCREMIENHEKRAISSPNAEENGIAFLYGGGICRIV